MTDKPKIRRFSEMRRLVARLRNDLNSGDQDFVLLYAYNGTGKTRLSMKLKDAGKRKNKGRADTLYFNAYTEDLFSLDNDLEKGSEPCRQGNIACSSMNELIFYTTEDGRRQITLVADLGTVWLTQPEMKELFQTTKRTWPST